jgi:hypothetical protein
MKYTRITAASLALAAVTLAACGGDSSKADSTKLANDSALAASIALANADSAAKISLGDTATGGTKAPGVTVSSPPRPRAATKTTSTKTTPAPATKTTTPTTGGTNTGSTSRMGVVDAGTSISLASNSKICTNTNAIGDNVTAVTTEAISGTNGASIPAGATVNMTVTNLKRSDNVTEKIVMEFRVVSISWGGKTHPVDASIADADVTRIRDQPQSKDIQKVAIGAAAGAIAGKIIGKSTKATVIGAAAGGAAGAATAAGTANYQGCINQGARITVRLDAPLQIVVGL